MPLQKLVFKPGLNREGTNYTNEGGWYDGDKIRFRNGQPEKIGGWTQVSPNQYLGVCRALWAWSDSDSGSGATYLGVGTNSKYYIYNGGSFNDITPIYVTATLGTTAIASTAGSPATITITDSTYNPSVGDYVNFATSTTVGGVFISGEYIVTSVPSATTYTINNTRSGTTATGGTGVVVQYEYPTGAIYYSVGTGWGEGPWGGLAGPISQSLGTDPFLITAGSNIVTVTQPNHGFTAVGQYLYISGAQTMQTVKPTFTFTSGSFTIPTTSKKVGFYGLLADSIPAYYLNSTFQVNSIIDVNTYTIVIQKTAVTSMAGGGSAITVQEQGGTRGWGTAYTGGGGIGNQIRLWTNDNFGADLVLAPRGGQVYYWQDANGVGTRALALSSIANTVASTITSFTFASGSSTAIASSAAGIYPYSFVTGQGIASGTYVSSSYVIGSTTIPLSSATTSASFGNYNVSFAGKYVPTQTYQVVASSIQQFVIVFGSNSYNGGTYSSTFNPMLVRWSDQANAYQWVPQTTNQSGEYVLTNGSYILGARSTRQEILIWTNTALYTMQYVGYPYVWSFQLLMDNISVVSPNCMITINNITYWMGNSKFYKYDGTVHTLPSTLRQYVFDDINLDQSYQIFAGTSEGFNEVWWFYVSNESLDASIDKYVVYNYLDDVWSYGSFETVQVSAGSFVVGKQYVISTVGTTNFTAIGAANNNVGTYFIATGTGSGTGQAWALNGRTAWLQNNIQGNPIAADYNSRLLYHESGVDDNATSSTQPIYAYVQSSDFGIMASDNNNSGQHFGFVWRMLPDINFNGSNQANPQVTIVLYPRLNNGTTYGTTDLNPVVSSQTFGTPTPSQYTIQQFTGEVYTRLRGRQLSLKCYSDTIGVSWQIGNTRFDVKQDGRR
jgi:hypothetical protein